MSALCALQMRYEEEKSLLDETRTLQQKVEDINEAGCWQWREL